MAPLKNIRLIGRNRPKPIFNALSRLRWNCEIFISLNADFADYSVVFCHWAIQPTKMVRDTCLPQISGQQRQPDNTFVAYPCVFILRQQGQHLRGVHVPRRLFSVAFQKVGFHPSFWLCLLPPRMAMIEQALIAHASFVSSRHGIDWASWTSSFVFYARHIQCKHCFCSRWTKTLISAHMAERKRCPCCRGHFRPIRKTSDFFA